MKSVIWKTGAIALLLSMNTTWAGNPGLETAVLLKYRDLTITRADFDAEVRRIPEANRNEVLASRARVDQILENLLLNRVFSTEARKVGMDKNPIFIKEIKLAEDRMLAKDFLDAQIERISLPDFDARAKEIYKVNPEKFTLKPMVDASHILVAIKDGKREEAIKQSNDLYNQLIAGADFEELAASRSDDKSARKNAGRLGYFSAEQMVKEFSDTAFALEKTGDISKPVESKFGYHIIKLQGKKSGGLQEYADVKDSIVEKLKVEYLTTARKDIINSIRGSSDIEANEAEIIKIKTKLPPMSKAVNDATGKAE